MDDLNCFHVARLHGYGKAAHLMKVNHYVRSENGSDGPTPPTCGVRCPLALGWGYQVGSGFGMVMHPSHGRRSGIRSV